MNQVVLWILVAAGFYLYLREIFVKKGDSQVDSSHEKHQDSFNPQNYELRETLMSPSERLFFEKLKRAVGDRFDIYPQVNLDKIFKTKYLSSKYEFNGAKWAIDRRSIDFLVTIRETQRPYVGIELDDSSHGQPDRIVRDEKVGKLFEDNGISLVRFNTGDNMSEDDLRKVFEKHF